MVPGTSGPPGPRAHLLALMEQCREPASVTARRTEVRSAEENGLRLATALSETALVRSSLTDA